MNWTLNTRQIYLEIFFPYPNWYMFVVDCVIFYDLFWFVWVAVLVFFFLFRSSSFSTHTFLFVIDGFIFTSFFYNLLFYTCLMNATRARGCVCVSDGVCFPIQLSDSIRTFLFLGFNYVTWTYVLLDLPNRNVLCPIWIYLYILLWIVWGWWLPTCCWLIMKQKELARKTNSDREGNVRMGSWTRA